MRNSPTNSIPQYRIGGIEGLRALAVLGVLAFHADYMFARGGFFGVDLFFVISGFLITRLLLAEIELTGGLAFSDFYLRRARRILPAMLATIAGAALLAIALAPDALTLLRKDALASLLFVSNWHYIQQQLSYFEHIGRQPLLMHFWSLAIEEQFYLLWPWVVLMVVRRGGRQALGMLAVSLAGFSAAWNGILAASLGFPDSMEISRVYFGTDTHAMGLAAGAALAAFTPRLEAAVSQERRVGGVGLWLGMAGLAGVLVLYTHVPENHPWLYPWALLFSSVCSLLLIVACLLSGTFGRGLDWSPIRWVGERSYGIYLWHWPVFMVTRPGIDLELSQHEAILLRVALTFGLAALSYRFIEAPLLGRSLRRPTNGTQLAAIVLVSLAILAAPILLLPTLPAVPDDSAGGIPKPDLATALPMPLGGNTLTEGSVNPSASTDSRSDAKLAMSGTYRGQLTVVGDSVVLGARSVIESSIQGTAVYAKVAWQATDVLRILEEISRAGELQPKVIIHLGTNGYVTEKSLRAMLALLRDRELVLVMNSRVPRAWMAPNNQLLAKVVPQYPNAKLIDWHGLSDGQSGFFVQDGVHLTHSGMKSFVASIIATGEISKVAPPSAKEPAPLLLPIMPEATEPEDYSATLERYPRPIASETFWELMARCETGKNWQHGGVYAGGLGIYVGTWRQWGGREFAPSPDLATREQQIIVANRVSTQGWMRPDGRFEKPVGFSGWGCLKTVDRPTLMMFKPESLLKQPFRWLQRGQVVRDLQSLLRLPVDGVYKERTAIRHSEILKQRGLPLALAAVAPHTQSGTVPSNATPSDAAAAGMADVAARPSSSAAPFDASVAGGTSALPAAEAAAPPPVPGAGTTLPTVAPETGRTTPASGLRGALPTPTTQTPPVTSPDGSLP